MSTIAEQLCDFRRNKLVHMFPPLSMADKSHACGVCQGAASHVLGRHSGRVIVIPSECGHPPYALGDDPTPYVASGETLGAIERLIDEAGKRHKKQARKKWHEKQSGE